MVQPVDSETLLNPSLSKRDQTRSFDWEQGSRIPSGPAAMRTAHRGRTHDRTRPRRHHTAKPLHRGGRSLIARSLSMSWMLRVLPDRGHGSLRGRVSSPQHLVRSTGAAMSTTSSHATHMAQGPLSQPTCTFAPGGQPLHPAFDRSVTQHRIKRPVGAPPVPPSTNGTARPSARCCGG